MPKPKNNAIRKIIGILGETGIAGEYALSIIFAFDEEIPKEIADSSLFSNKYRYKASFISCCLLISLNCLSFFGAEKI